ncbi:lysophospholipid acyltransferase 5 [Neocloeon triangulifer]|uniref:lysophospholipid acyltransferase 5 n=1 Tax=Neocloeon triangulifer TaxID=2078957 RepID=UPI00286EBC6D|nr:lysophospholipid acyltransferase 5 [Neocloeon triangulifer]XP_059486596.1 lysophospholipid acyltransferase 5 [Neocloeon triangulifer]
MTTADDPSILAPLAATLSCSVPALKLLLSLVVGYPIAFFHRNTLYGKNANLQHLFFLLCGLAIGVFNYKLGVFHSVSAVLVTYTILKACGGTLASVILCFLFNMGYLVIGYFYTGTETYDIKWSMPHCVLTLRLIGLAFDVYDGRKSPEALSKDQKFTAMDRTPSLLEVAGYTYFPASYMVGPQFPMTRYLSMINGTMKPEGQEKPECMVPGLLRGLGGFIYLGIYQVGNIYYKDDYLLSEAFLTLPFWKRALNMGIWGKITMYKYISCWMITEGVCISSGLTYNGENANGKVKWNGCANVQLRVYEGAVKFGHLISSFNTNTNHWVMQYIYKRLKFMNNRYISQATTLFFLALWHGLHSGYYMSFFLEFIIMKMEKEVEQLLHVRKDLSEALERPGVWHVLWVIRKLYLVVFMGYCLTPFVLLSYHKWMIAFNAVYWMGHILFVPWFLFGHVVIKALRPKRTKEE